MTTHSSILAWRISWTEEPGRATVDRVAELDMTEMIWHACMHIYNISMYVYIVCLLLIVNFVIPNTKKEILKKKLERNLKRIKLSPVIFPVMVEEFIFGVRMVFYFVKNIIYWSTQWSN